VSVFALRVRETRLSRWHASASADAPRGAAVARITCGARGESLSLLDAAGAALRTFARVAPPYLPQLAPPLPASASGLPGLYSAPYGPHGYEIIHVTWRDGSGSGSAAADAQSADAALPPGVSAHTPRLEGLKVTGDPNVPTGRLSFVAPLAPSEASEHQTDDDDARQIVSFTPQGPLLGAFVCRGACDVQPAHVCALLSHARAGARAVDLAERHVTARLRCFGQARLF
jgi:hypothetical protein